MSEFEFPRPLKPREQKVWEALMQHDTMHGLMEATRIPITPMRKILLKFVAQGLVVDIPASKRKFKRAETQLNENAGKVPE